MGCRAGMHRTAKVISAPTPSPTIAIAEVSTALSWFAMINVWAGLLQIRDRGHILAANWVTCLWFALRVRVLSASHICPTTESGCGRRNSDEESHQGGWHEKPPVFDLRADQLGSRMVTLNQATASTSLLVTGLISSRSLILHRRSGNRPKGLTVDLDLLRLPRS